MPRKTLKKPAPKRPERKNVPASITFTDVRAELHTLAVLIAKADLEAAGDNWRHDLYRRVMSIDAQVAIINNNIEEDIVKVRKMMAENF